MSTLPAAFLWGASVAGHQVEGDNTNSDTWFLENVEPTVFAERSGKACNSYQLWETDLDLLAALGLNAFRFSTEWARIEPEQGVIDAASLDHYDRMVDGCLARGIAPVVTFNHFTLPHWVAKKGAWLDADVPDLFAQFCGTVTAKLGDRLAAGVTLNEPNLPRLLSWILPEFVHEQSRATLDAASRAAGVERYRTGNVMVPEDYDGMQEGMTRGHLLARNAIRAEHADLPVGLSIAMVDDVALPGGEAIRDRKRAALYDHWLDLARDDDFIGVQNYERLTYGPGGEVPAPEGGLRNQMGQFVDPGSLRGAIEYAHARSGKPVFVTEHGMSTTDDSVREEFTAASIDAMLDSIAEGTPVLGYLHWSLIDNFEWIFGYGPRFGLHSFDTETFERTAKPSAARYAEIVREHRAPAGRA
ncbi:family 1 glycosylhydrolase [Microbacterium elymi]|uniref:Family 1 glycosylhydrolase n=1 Tax=Microbacterium elymi TaxID=2909587 RepID=A0ABY5NM83_9MICO|nr:family 1 glycosylhydrolase [Microbacterium elymi]UUT36161.1 family 1 glycosylhydrolase [Microbacterium elymi]